MKTLSNEQIEFLTNVLMHHGVLELTAREIVTYPIGLMSEFTYRATGLYVSELLQPDVVDQYTAIFQKSHTN